MNRHFLAAASLTVALCLPLVDAWARGFGGGLRGGGFRGGGFGGARPGGFSGGMPRMSGGFGGGVARGPGGGISGGLGNDAKSDVSIQLAVNKQGVSRGNYTDTVTNKNQVIQGSVDKQNQRVAFTVGDNTTNVIETGLYNLTKDEAPCLLHFGNERTEQWLLVRLQNTENASS